MTPILMIAYHYPPEGSSSGVLRTLKFSKHLPSYGWRPHILTLHESLYRERDDALLGDVPPDAVIHRTPALDATYHLAFKGRYLAILGIPDRFASWLPFGIAKGLSAIRRHRIRVLYSTSPYPTAHLIALALKFLTGLPWVADFRDPWIEPGSYPRPGTLRYRLEAALEARVILSANRVTVTTDHFREHLLTRYPELDPDRVVTILNGYDEDDFAGLETARPAPVFEILHTGLVNPNFRDPVPLLRALRAAIDRGAIKTARTRLVFLGGGPHVTSAGFSAAVDALGLNGIVTVGPRLPYRMTLRRMGEAAVLLLLQASDDTRMLIPAKAFEYLRIGRPILALTGDGATAELIRRTASGIVADWTSVASIESALVAMYRDWIAHPLGRPRSGGITEFERASLARKLVGIFETLTATAPVGYVGAAAREHKGQP